MLIPKLDQTLSIGTLLGVLAAFLGVLATVSGLLYNWRKDQLLKRKEYADRVRRAGGMIIAKLDRWQELSVRFFEDIQPALTDADGMFTKDRNTIATRDYLWRELVGARARSSQRILDEEIEIAYVDLYGYDPRIQELFTAVVDRLKSIDRDCYDLLLKQTQLDIFALKAVSEISSAVLGNALRVTAGTIARECQRLMDRLVEAFRSQAMKLIEAADSAIIDKHVDIQGPSDCLPEAEPLSVSFPVAKESMSRTARGDGLSELLCSSLDDLLDVEVFRPATILDDAGVFSRVFSVGPQTESMELRGFCIRTAHYPASSFSSYLLPKQDDRIPPLCVLLAPSKREVSQPGDSNQRNDSIQHHSRRIASIIQDRIIDRFRRHNRPGSLAQQRTFFRHRGN